MKMKKVKRLLSIVLTIVLLVGLLPITVQPVWTRNMGKQGYFNTVSLGENHYAAIATNGGLYTWGGNGHGQLGLGDYNINGNKDTPTKVPGISNVVAVSFSACSSAAITANGDLYTWGFNYYGQLGLGDNTERCTPTKVTGLENVVAISFGEYSCAAITTNGDLYTWGYNYYGQLGLGDRNSRNVPTKVTELSNVVAVSMSEFSGAAITTNGDLYTWGYNFSGQLGFDDITQRYTPTKVTGLSNIVAVSLGRYHSAAITTNGDLYTWGKNDYGQLGLDDIDDITDRHTPTKVTGLSNIVAVSLGRYHSAAITTNGDLYTWGENDYGQLGLDDITDRHTPTKVTGLSNIVAVSLGEYRSAAITATGDLYIFITTGPQYVMSGVMLPDGSNSSVSERINFDTDRWRFSNQCTTIAYNFYRRLYGPVQGTLLYQNDKCHGTGGQCYGMAATTATINERKQNATIFGHNYLIDVALNDLSSEIGMTAADFIKYGYILQYCGVIGQEKNNTTNNLQKLYTMVRAFQSGSGESIVIGVRGDIGDSTDCGHAIYPLRIGNETETICEIIVNDSNFPNEARTITLTKNNGAFTGWSYPITSGVTWGSGFPNGRIYYSTPTLLLYSFGYYYNQGYGENVLIQNDNLLLSSDTGSFTVQSGNYTENVLTGYRGSDWLIPIQTESGTNELKGMYWVDSNQSLTISNLKEATNITLAGYGGSIGAEIPAKTVIQFTVSDQGGEQAKLDLPKGSNFNLTYSTGNGEYLDHITISGQSNGIVKTNSTEKGVLFSGVHNVTISAEIEGKTSSKFFSNISDDDVKEIVINDIGSAIEITLADVSGYSLSGKVISVTGDVRPATVTLKQNSNTIYTAYTNQNGDYAFNNVVPGSYSLVITKASYLSYTRNFLVVSNQSITYKNITLIPGDIDGDGHVSYNDFLKFLENYNKQGANIQNPAADINGDGYVDYNDFITFLSGYGKSATIDTQ